MTFKTFEWVADGIHDGTVVPIIGSELYARPDGMLCEHELSSRLAAELGLTDVPPTATPRDVALVHQVRNPTSPPAILNDALRRLFGELIATPPAPLVQLAEIRDLKLYVTTAFDDLLQQALRNANRPPLTFVHASDVTKSAMDLPDTRRSIAPSVCHVLGRFPKNYAITDAEVLEYLRALLDPVCRPKRFFDELAGKDLLFLGCGFPDWLSRLFIRAMQDAPFARGSSRTQVIADAQLATDSKLALFLSGHQMMVYPPGGAVDFVRELHASWTKNYGAAAPVPQPNVPVPVVTEDTVFLSFSSEDRAIVGPIAAALHAGGVENVFFDEKSIPPGEDWDRLIMTNVRRAMLFVPFVSQRTEGLADAASYFWREWNVAGRQADSYAQGAKFILPIKLDDGLDPARARVPDAFRIPQWFKLDPNNVAELVDYIRKEYRQKQASKLTRRS